MSFPDQTFNFRGKEKGNRSICTDQTYQHFSEVTLRIISGNCTISKFWCYSEKVQQFFSNDTRNDFRLKIKAIKNKLSEHHN